MGIPVIREHPKTRFSDQLLAGLANLSSSASQEIPKFFGEQILRKNQEKSYENLGLPEGFSGLPMELQKIAAQNLLKGSVESSKKMAPLMAGLATVQKMRQLGKKGNLGFGSGVLSSVFGGERAKEYGEYEQLGKSLISLASNIPIRNKAEFETLAAKLFDPSIRDSEREGILDAMEHIISQSLGVGQVNAPDIEESSKKRPPLSSFHR